MAAAGIVFWLHHDAVLFGGFLMFGNKLFSREYPHLGTAFNYCDVFMGVLLRCVVAFSALDGPVTDWAP